MLQKMNCSAIRTLELGIWQNEGQRSTFKMDCLIWDLKDLMCSSGSDSVSIN